MHNTWTFALVSVFVATLARSTAHADQAESQRAAARELGTLGMQAYFDKDYAHAADHLDHAYRLFSTPTLGLWSGRALIEVGRWLQAAERLRETQLASAAVGDNAAQRQAQADASAELQALEPRIPRLTITIEGAEPNQVSVRIDDRPLAREQLGTPQLFDPGPHRIVGTFEAQRIELEVTLQASETQRAPLIFNPPPPPAASVPVPVPVPVPALTPSPPNPLRIAAITSLSLGGAGLATSLLLTWLATNQLDDCAKREGEYYCSDREADAYENYRNIATATFYSGAALAGAGLALWLLQPSAADQPQTLKVSLSPAGAHLSVKF